ncbi:hypothetical protein Glove_355g25 [Diversispora epigaea]|uniref:Protein kinase domain-containing protein n=1 Tax=Diversispora epigaea TaxID=1348612 RepID=A0A397HB51_9GLOM|nr:hypothetical protein Glove_355g25 [Diversispora epigaea]
MDICPGCNQEYRGIKWCRKVIEWIPYDRFKDVKQIGKGRFGTIHYARWIDGLMDLLKIGILIINNRKDFKQKKMDICPGCNQEYRGIKWCRSCNSKHFQNDFKNWTNAQLNVDKGRKVIEWIPYDRFKDVKQIGKDEGEDEDNDDDDEDEDDDEDKEDDDEDEDEEEDEDNDDDEEVEVALKKFENFVNFKDVFNEMAIHLKTYVEYASIKFYGITQDPETHNMQKMKIFENI